MSQCAFCGCVVEAPRHELPMCVNCTESFDDFRSGVEGFNEIASPGQRNGMNWMFSTLKTLLAESWSEYRRSGEGFQVALAKAATLASLLPVLFGPSSDDDSDLSDFDRIDREAARILDGVMSQREEVVAAFLAKHGFAPEECEQVIRECDDGVITWRVQRRSDLETKQGGTQ